MHTHIMPKELPRWSEKFGYGGFIHLYHHRPGYARMMQDSKFFREVNENCWDPDIRIQEYVVRQLHFRNVSIPVAKNKSISDIFSFLIYSLFLRLLTTHLKFYF